MRIVFMGTPDLAAHILRVLAAQHELAAVYTRPDAVRKRGKELQASPVKECALELGIPVFTPRSLRDLDVQEALATLRPDVICVAAYGALLPRAVLDIPPYGCLNVHASLLPRWRGAAPIERAILAGDAQTGVCIMRMEEGLDTGSFCVCKRIDIGTQTTAELTRSLAELGANALCEALDALKDGSCTWTAQAKTGLSYAEKLLAGELNLALTDSAEEALRKVRASSDAHPCKMVLGGRRLTVLSAQAAPDTVLPAGRVTFQKRRLLVGCAQGSIELMCVKPDGKRAMDAAAFATGIPNAKTTQLTWEAYGTS